MSAGSTEGNRLRTHDTSLAWWDGILLESYSSGVIVIQKTSVSRITRSTLSEDDLFLTNLPCCYHGYRAVTTVTVLLPRLPCCYHSYCAVTMVTVLLPRLPCCYHSYHAVTTVTVLLQRLPCCYHAFETRTPNPLIGRLESHRWTIQPPWVQISWKSHFLTSQEFF